MTRTGNLQGLLSPKLTARAGAGRADYVEEVALAAKAADGIVNATPVGMVKMPGMPINSGFIEPRHWVADIVYFPLETALLAHARAKGCAVLSGAGMASFRRFGRSNCSPAPCRTLIG